MVVERDVQQCGISRVQITIHTYPNPLPPRQPPSPSSTHPPKSYTDIPVGQKVNHHTQAMSYYTCPTSCSPVQLINQPAHKRGVVVHVYCVSTVNVITDVSYAKSEMIKFVYDSALSPRCHKANFSFTPLTTNAILFSELSETFINDSSYF